MNALSLSQKLKGKNMQLRIKYIIIGEAVDCLNIYLSCQVTLTHSYFWTDYSSDQGRHIIYDIYLSATKNIHQYLASWRNP